MAKSKTRTPQKVTPITINGEDMFLKYNLLALKVLSKKNVDLTNITPENPLTMEDIIKVLHCGLLTYDPTITEDEVAMLVDIDELEYIMEKISEALNSSTEITEKK